MDPNPPTSRPAPPARRKGRTSATTNDSAPTTPNTDLSEDTFRQPETDDLDPALDHRLSPLEMNVSDTQIALTSPSQPSDTDAPKQVSHFLENPDDVEDVIGGLTKQDLFLALQRAKFEMDRLDALVSSQTLEVEDLQSLTSDLSTRLANAETEGQRLTTVVKQREARIDEITEEQSKIEDDVYSKLGQLERLKAQTEEGERKRVEVERKLADVTQTADKEREYTQDQEAHLKAANARLISDVQALKQERLHLRDTIRSLMAQNDIGSNGVPASLTEKQSNLDTADSAASAADASLGAQKGQVQLSSIELEYLVSEKQDENAKLLEEELEHLRKTLCSQDTALAELRAKLNDERTRAAQLEEEKTELESMLTGNTLEHLMMNRAGGQWQTNRYSDTVSSHSSRSHDDNKTDATSIAPYDDEDARRDFESDDVGTTPRAIRAPRSPRKDTLGKIAEPAEPLSNGLDEIIALDGLSTLGEAKASTLSEPDQKELIRLRQENKRLEMYVTKILNRILSMEGFERVLAADGMSADGTRTLRGTMGRTVTSRPAAVSIIPAASKSTNSDDAKKERRRSAGVFGLSRTRSPLLSVSPQADDASLPVSPTPSIGNVATQATSTSSRTSSVDWKSLRLPWSSTAAEEKPNANLRPFALSTSTSRLEVPANSEVKVSSPRLPNLEEEHGDDGDELERQRARTLLQMEGLTVPAHQLAPASPQAQIKTASPAPATNVAAPLQSGLSSFLSRMMSSEPATLTGSVPPKESGATFSSSSKTLVATADGPQFTQHLNKSQRPRRPARGSSAMSGGTSPSLSLAELDEVAGTMDEPGAGSRMSNVGPDAAGQQVQSQGYKDRDTAEVEVPTWRKALKRMSLLTAPSATLETGVEGASPKVDTSPASSPSVGTGDGASVPVHGTQS